MENPPARKREPEARLPKLGKPGKHAMNTAKWKSTRDDGGYEVWNTNEQPVSGITWFTRVGAERERERIGDGTLIIVSIHYVSDRERF